MIKKRELRNYNQKYQALKDFQKIKLKFYKKFKLKQAIWIN